MWSRSRLAVGEGERTVKLSDTLIAGALGVLLALSSGSAHAKILAQWIQLGPDGTASARAITDEASCPAVTFDGAVAAMGVRSTPEQTFGNVKAAKFPVRSCEVTVPSGTRVATLGARQSRGLLARRRRLVPFPRSCPDGIRMQ
jgi:hypothetical protein